MKQIAFILLFFLSISAMVSAQVFDKDEAINHNQKGNVVLEKKNGYKDIILGSPIGSILNKCIKKGRIGENYYEIKNIKDYNIDNQPIKKITIFTTIRNRIYIIDIEFATKEVFSKYWVLFQSAFGNPDIWSKENTSNSEDMWLSKTLGFSMNIEKHNASFIKNLSTTERKEEDVYREILEKERQKAALKKF